MKERIVKGWNRARARYETLKKRVKKMRARIEAFKQRLSFLAVLKEGNNLALFILGLVIIYGFIAQFLGWV